MVMTIFHYRLDCKLMSAQLISKKNKVSKSAESAENTRGSRPWSTLSTPQRHTQNSSAPTIRRTLGLCLALQPKISKLRNHYYKWFSILFWLLFTKSLSQESRVPSSNNTLFEFLTYWHHVQMITLAFTFLCALPQCQVLLVPEILSNPWKK
jgi:hypothetical protein